MKKQKTTKPTIFSFFGVLFFSALGLIWFSQQSINAYWQQTYHQESPIAPLSKYSFWQKGEELQQYLLQKYQNLDLAILPRENNNDFMANQESQIEKGAQEIPGVFKDEKLNPNASLNSQNIVEKTKNDITTEDKNKLNALIKQLETPNKLNQAERQNTENFNRPQNNEKSEIVKSATQENKPINKTPLPKIKNQIVQLSRQDKVFFAGDSLMQGVAPFVQQYLRKNYNINTVNLSKQSTGLAYPKFFDWPKTIEQTLNADKQIKLLVIFLGPNDPWDMPNPKGGAFLKFASSEWNSLYLSRVERILNAAKKNNVAVIWLGIPYMKKKQLNDQMRTLDSLLKNYLMPRVIWLPTDYLLSGGQMSYVDSILLNQKSTIVRSKDGIHFSAKGQKLLADYIEQHISISN